MYVYILNIHAYARTDIEEMGSCLSDHCGMQEKANGLALVSRVEVCAPDGFLSECRAVGAQHGRLRVYLRVAEGGAKNTGGRIKTAECVGGASQEG